MSAIKPHSVCIAQDGDADTAAPGGLHLNGRLTATAAEPPQRPNGGARRALPSEGVRILAVATGKVPNTAIASSLRKVLNEAFAGWRGRKVVLFPGAQCFPGSTWPPTSRIVTGALERHGAAAMFETHDPCGDRVYRAHDPVAPALRGCRVRQRFATSTAATEGAVRALVGECRGGQRTIVLDGIPVGLLVCGENNVLRNIQSEGNRVEIRHLGGSRLFNGDVRVVFNGAHTEMGNWGKLSRRFEWLSAKKRWAFFGTNVANGWRRTSLRAYYDGRLVATARGVESSARAAGVTVIDGGVACRALLVQTSAGALVR